MCDVGVLLINVKVNMQQKSFEIGIQEEFSSECSATAPKAGIYGEPIDGCSAAAPTIGIYGEHISEFSAPPYPGAPKKRRAPRIQRTLAVLLVSMVGHNVVLELKNDAEVSGVIDEADENMNLTLSKVKYVSLSGTIRDLESAFIIGTSIVYVHISPQIQVRQHLGNYIKQKEIAATRSQPAKWG